MRSLLARLARPRSVLAGLLGMGLLVLVVAAPASAHIQVSPGTAAPDDAVRFSFVVPNERDTATVKVVIALPKDVLPFSYAETPGWTRTLQEGADGSPATVTWTGRLASDGFVEFSFLASTPATPTDLAWKALQYYAGDADPVRWIGAPDSEYPAPVTKVLAAATKANAGGESGTAPAAGPEVDAAPVTPAATSVQSTDDGGSDLTARILGGAGALAGGAALLLVLLRRRAAR